MKRQKPAVLTILGSCSGTEPMPGRHHTSLTIEHANRLYWFDAGETCSYTAHVMGLELLRTEAIFISHTHMDHIGGLPNLLWNLRKLCNVKPEMSKVSPEALADIIGRTIPIYLPDTKPFDGIMQLLQGTEGGFAIKFGLDPVRYNDGEIFRKDDFAVEALHNLHLGAEPPWLSYSFRIRAGEKTVTFTGDVKHISDIEPFLNSSDYLLVETGHHSVETICGYLVENEIDFGQLVFTHHGRAILRDPRGELEKARQLVGDRVVIAEDGLRITL